MRLSTIKFLLCIICVDLLTVSAAAKRFEPPPCPAGSTRLFLPEPQNPLWIACRSADGLYQGHLIQLSQQGEVIRIAGIQNSERQGVEMRFGVSGTLEERNFDNGHLNGKSFIFPTHEILGRVLPPTLSTADWQKLLAPSSESRLKSWLHLSPVTTLEFIDGRLVSLLHEKLSYHFRISKDARIFPLDHPELKNLFFIDPEPLWNLNAKDMRAALTPGFGSCKKYSGPLGRFVRHYDHLLYKREASEKKHLARLDEIRDRFLKFCVPADISENLGKVECPPTLPGTTPASDCVIGFSDQIRIPYQPKYFSNEFTLGRTPETFHEIAKANGALKFASDPTVIDSTLNLGPEVQIRVQKSSHGMRFRMMEKKVGQSQAKDEWYEWHRVSGF